MFPQSGPAAELSTAAVPTKSSEPRPQRCHEPSYWGGLYIFELEHEWLCDSAAAFSCSFGW